MLDEKDKAILALLARNARVTITSMSNLIKISDVATKKRLMKLESRGVILGYRPIVNPRELGYEAVALIGLNTEPGKVVEVAEILSGRPDTTFVAIASGDHEVVAELWAKNTRELQQKIKDIEKLGGVKEICPAILVNVVKQHTSIPEEFTKENV
ncbi:MAG: Lrp/AsnC family transcriptional regulator [Sulfolobales archaeon]|nr:Lrp/AsnC family transcriptional regulator [Sulfolobales archaeon]MDW8083297.1 Lrp/AsnC family transcriptional regulator [Sulfolobales archaeon]